MIIVTFNAVDGGVGKTTLSFNFAEYLAFKGYKVLIIDKDHQCNLTTLYDIYDQENTVANIYKGSGEVEIVPLKENLDLIKGYMRLDEIEDSIVTNPNKYMMFYMWLEDNYEKIGLDKYDYLIIDTHPDFRVATKNAVVASHAIIAPVLDSDNTDSANLEHRLDEYKKETIDFRTRESLVTAQLFRVGNRVSHNTKVSQKFKEHIKNNDKYINYIPLKSIFNKSIAEKNRYHKNMQKMMSQEMS
ncbi:ParA family protein [Mammaliicoccus sciuri]|uniref:ParA family protein n=1 Tax=Mammaliicoccus sciuri TaxID=1296 RepID=UPI003A8EE7E1